MLILTAAVSLMLAQAAEPATAKPAPPAAGARAETPAQPKRICRQEVSTGSAIPTRICRTPEEMEAERRKAEQGIRSVSDHNALCRGRSC